MEEQSSEKYLPSLLVFCCCKHYTKDENMKFDVRSDGMPYTVFGSVTNENVLPTIGSMVELHFEEYDLEVAITDIDGNQFTGMIISVEHDAGLVEPQQIRQGSEISFKEENIFTLYS